LAISLAGAHSACANWVYNANSDFTAFELANSGNQTPAFSNFTVGYSLTLGGFTAFAATEHTDNWISKPGLEGWYIANNASVPAVVVNTSNSSVQANQSIDPSQIVMHPGGTSADAYATPYSNAVLRFTATNAGIYSVIGDWESLDVGPTMNYVLKNGTTLFSSALDDSTFNLLSISLAQGDTIDFVVDAGAYSGSDMTGLRATLTGVADIPAVPEPATLTLFGLGGIGLAGIAKRRRARKVA
jgi:hypothetical protein